MINVVILIFFLCCIYWQEILDYLV